MARDDNNGEDDERRENDDKSNLPNLQRGEARPVQLVSPVHGPGLYIQSPLREVPGGPGGGAQRVPGGGTMTISDRDVMDALCNLEGIGDFYHGKTLEVFKCIAWNIGKGRRDIPSRLIQRWAGISEGNVSKEVKRLEQCGAIIVDRQPNMYNRYTLGTAETLLPPAPKPSDEADDDNPQLGDTSAWFAALAQRNGGAR